MRKITDLFNHVQEYIKKAKNIYVFNNATRLRQCVTVVRANDLQDAVEINEQLLEDEKPLLTYQILGQMTVQQLEDSIGKVTTEVLFKMEEPKPVSHEHLASLLRDNGYVVVKKPTLKL